MSYLVQRQFWTDCLERVVSTAAQTGVAAFGTGAFAEGVTNGELGSLPWQGATAITALAAFLAFLKALAAGKVGDPSTASLTSGTAPDTISYNAYLDPSKVKGYPTL